MNIGMTGKFVVHKQKVQMKDGIPVLDENGMQILTGEREKVAEFNNLITDNGLNSMVSLNVIQYFYLSANNSEPTVTDNAVAQFLGGSNTYQDSGYVDANLATAPYYVTKYQTMRFIAGVGTGNISKISVGWGTINTPTGLWSSALVKDASGANTVITKLADESLDVTYQLRSYLSGVDYTGVVSISGVNYNVVVRASQFKTYWFGSGLLLPAVGTNFVRASSGDIEPITGFPSGAANPTGTISHKPYVDMSFQLEKVFSFALGNANYPTGIRSIQTYFDDNVDCFHWQIRFGKSDDDSAIMKTSNDTLTLPTFITSWGRYVTP